MTRRLEPSPSARFPRCLRFGFFEVGFDLSVGLALIGLVCTTSGIAMAQSNSILDRVRERASTRATTETENRANEKVDGAVDKTMDCVFDPVACAKKTTTPAPGGEAATAPGATVAAGEWYAEKDGQRVGPMPQDQLAAMVTSGQATTATLVWREGMSAWMPAGEVAELSDAFKKLPPPLPPRSGPPPLPAQR